MEAFWLINEASLARPGEAQAEVSIAKPSMAGASGSFPEPIEQAPGATMQLDTELFIESWTLGVVAASENFLRRQEKRTNHEHGSPASDTISSFTQVFVTREEIAAEAEWRVHEACVEQGSVFQLQYPGTREERDGHAADETEIACPLTLKSACGVLGVTATSTQEEIRTAYRKSASRYHPDRVAWAAARVQKLASDRMASINEAYRMLCAGPAG